MALNRSENMLINYIKDKKINVHEKLPTEITMCEDLNLSRFVLRDLINSLKTKGILRTRQGSGTYLNCNVDYIYNTLNNNLSMRQIIESNGHKAGVSFFEKTLTRVGSKISEALDIEEDADVLRFRRVRTADGIPVAYSEIYVSPLISGVFLTLTNNDFSFYDVLESKCNMELGISIIEITARITDRELSEFLMIDEGTPINELQQINQDINGTPLMFIYEFLKPDYCKLLVSRSK